jgi:hypothetical protein
VLPLVMLQATDANDFITVVGGMESLRLEKWRVKNLAFDLVEGLQTFRNHATVGENGLGLAQASAVRTLDCGADIPIAWCIREPAVWAVPEVVEHPYVVDEPDDFVAMWNQMRLGAEANDPVCGSEINPAKSHHLIEDQIRGVDFWQVDSFNLMALFLQHGF